LQAWSRKNSCREYRRITGEAQPEIGCESSAKSTVSGLAPKTEMRSGPATQTAFAMREFHHCLPRSVPFRFGRCCQRLSVFGSKLRRLPSRPKTRLHPITWLVAVSPCETVSEEAATPGCPQRFHVQGTSAVRPLHCSSRPSGLPFAGLAVRSPSFQIRIRQALGITAAEPALRDHWQRDVHACSE
jgi:hypothetical protein